MKLEECRELLACWAAQRPGSWDGLTAAVEAADASAGGADWAAVASAFSADGGLGLVARVNGETAQRLRWDAKLGALVERRTYLGRRGKHLAVRLERADAPPEEREERSAPFARALFASDELTARFRTFAARCPVESVETEWANGLPTGTWRLRLKEPEPWARFLRLDAAIPFGAEAPALSLLLAARHVAALGFEGDEPWAELAG